MTFHLLRFIILSCFLLPTLHAADSWYRALPFSGYAEGGWTLTVSGSFSGTTYICRFTSTGEGLSSNTVDSGSATVTNGKLPCTAPNWAYAAYPATLQVFSTSNTITPIAGPGGTAELITFVAAWKSRASTSGSAQGGSAFSFAITGVGFDTAATDYVCKFVCNRAGCDSSRFAQSSIPVTPASSTVFTCTPPEWPFSASLDTAGIEGKTQVVIEKGGVLLDYIGGLVGAEDYIYLAKFKDTDKTAGLATEGSELVTINGFGFDVDSVNYTCQFSEGNDRVGMPATPVSSNALTCFTPTWPTIARTVRIQIYKQDCAGSRGNTALCSASYLVSDLGSVLYTLTQSVRSLSVTEGPAASASTVITVNGGGFDGTHPNYTVTWTDGINSVEMPVNATGSGTEMPVKLPVWGFSPNAITQVQVLQNNVPLDVHKGVTLTFAFNTSWTQLGSGGLAVTGLAEGGDMMTIVGSGFVSSVPAGNGLSDDYACKFRDASGNILLSDRVAPVSTTNLVCKVPAWGVQYVATATVLTVVKGDYEFASPTADYLFESFWQAWSISVGQVGGGEMLTITGAGFNTSRLHKCKFSYNNDELFAFSAEAFPINSQTAVCITPQWRSWQEAKTSLQFLEIDKPLTQKLIAATQYRNATFEFLPGFVVSQQLIEIFKGSISKFSFVPDTMPTDTVTVTITSSNSSIAAVSSPYTITPADDIEDNTREVSIHHVRPGFSSLSIASAGANYGHTYKNIVQLLCKASVLVDRNGAVMRLGSGLELQIGIDYVLTGNISVQVSSSNTAVFTVDPPMLSFSDNDALSLRKPINLLCTGIGTGSLTLRVTYFGTNILYRDVVQVLPVFGLPGIGLSPTSLVVQPDAEGAVSIAPDTAPTLTVEFSVVNSNPSSVSVPTAVTFPTLRTTPKLVPISHVSHGTSEVKFVGSSPSLRQQLSVGCSVPDAEACTAQFVSNGCNFTGYHQNGGDYRWTAIMQALSASVGVTDCSQYDGCFRISCCTSTPAQQCISSAETGSCNLDMFIPPLTATEDSTFDFGAVPQNIESMYTLYNSWVNGIDCEPYVPCAWERCFPGGGNYDGVESGTVTIQALPGFSIVPSVINLQQGVPVQVQVTPRKHPSSSFVANVSVTDLSGNPQSAPTAIVEPLTLFFNSSEAQNLSIYWLSPGRGSLQLKCGPEAGDYANVTHLLRNAISSSPAFDFTPKDLTGLSGELVSRIGAPTILVKVGTNYTFKAKLSDSYSPVTQWNVLDQPDILEITPLTVRYGPNLPSEYEISLIGKVAGVSDLMLSSPSGHSQALHVLSSGTGYTSGSITVEGYGGSGFSATYSVGVSDWEFYFDAEAMTSARGANYSFQGNSSFSSPITNTSYIHVGTCYRDAQEVLSGVHVVRHEGIVVVGCAPHINFTVENGAVKTLSFDNGTCLATGLVCELTLPGFGGTGFRAYFKTGFTDLAVSQVGSGYLCDWACFASVNSKFGTHPVSGHGRLGHVQACPIGFPTCNDGFAATARVVYGSLSELRSTIRVFSAAQANISSSLDSLQQTQTATITVTPLEIPTGIVDFTVTASTPLLQLTQFSFAPGCLTLETCARTFTATHLGGGSSVAKINIAGSGVGNYDGFRASFTLSLLPGFNLSADAVTLQHYPGFSIVQFAPDTPPTKDTEVVVHVITEFGTDVLLDSFGQKILDVPSTLIMRAGTIQPQELRIVHGGVEGFKMRNRVTGTATITFSVSDPESNYNGVGIVTSTKTIAVNVRPGFESNVQGSYTRALQKGTVFVFRLWLDHAPTAAVNITLSSSDPSLVAITPTRRTVPQSVVGPLEFELLHRGVVGTASLSIEASTMGGNYEGVTAIDYLALDMKPGFVLPTPVVHLQNQQRVTTFLIGLDTAPTADTEVSVVNANPDIVTTSTSVEFLSNEWASALGSAKAISVMWHAPGTVNLTFSAKSPGGNYHQVISGLVTVRTYRPLTVSRSVVNVQKGGVTDVSVSLPLKPAIPTTVTATSSPPGVVSVNGPFIVPQASNDTFVVIISHLQRGSATVRLVAAAAGDIFDGSSHDIYVTSMPGFNFDQPNILLYSCFSSPVCEKEFTFSPEIAPTADVTAVITSSDTSVVTVSPSTFVFPVANGTAGTHTVKVTYVSTGVACLSFAATSTGNYDRVSSGGVNITALPDFRVDNLVIVPTNGGEAHGIADFDLASPIIYVQSGSFSNFTIAPSVLPTADAIVVIDNPSPNLVEVTSQVHFKEGSLTPQVVTVRHIAVGNVRISLRGFGGNYESALWSEGILVKALPALIVDAAISVRYHFPLNFTVQASSSDPLIGTVRLNVSSLDTSLVSFPKNLIPLTGQEPVNVELLHLNPGFTRIRAIAIGPESNYHYAEGVIRLTLNYPGFDVQDANGVATTTLHVQRWSGNTLTGTDAGFNDIYLSPNERPDSTTTVNVDNNAETVIEVQSQDYVVAIVKTTDLLDKLAFYSELGGSPFPDPKYFRGIHKGVVGTATFSFGSPQADRWPDASGCASSDNTCGSFLQAVYAGIVMPIPDVLVIAHAGFTAPFTSLNVQRQNQADFQMALDTVPSADVRVYFTSSNTAIATVQDSVLFVKGDTAKKNVTVNNLIPGTAQISFRAESTGLDYGGALVTNAITINCLEGFGISSLLVHVQSPPTDKGMGEFQMTPDSVPTHAVTLTISSSNTAQIIVTSSVTFPAGVRTTQNISLTHISSGSIDSTVKISFTLSTDAASNYFSVIVPRVQVIPLGTFVISESNVQVQKGRTKVITITPNILPDQDVVVHVTVSNTSVISASASFAFSAKKLDAASITITHIAAGSATLSFHAVSVEGNYNGAKLADAVNVTARHGFVVYSRVPGLVADTPQAPITSEIVLQAQPTSHLGSFDFLVNTDIPVDQRTVFLVISSDNNVVTSSSNITFEAGDRAFKRVTITHGGTSGNALVSFKAVASVPTSNYQGVESGDVPVRALAGFAFSAQTVNVQKNGIGTFTIRPDTLPTTDFVLSMVSSDPSVASVPLSQDFTKLGGIGAENTKTITITYQSQGTVTISFFATGGNYEGVIWSNGIVAASRPGFIVSSSDIVIPYDGTMDFVVTPDTLPTADTTVQILSSQPAKAAPTISSFLLRAGIIESKTITIKSWCSVTPGNCARAGSTAIGFIATSDGSNYNGVDSGTSVVATVSAPALKLSSSSVFVQQSAVTATFTVGPTVLPNVDTIVSFTSLDTGVCTVIASVALLAGQSADKTVTVSWVGVGDTRIRVNVYSPSNSNYVNIDPVFVYVRSLASFTPSRSNVIIQAQESILVTLTPSFEFDADVSVTVSISDTSVISVVPSSITFTPPRQLIGRDVTAAAGLRVVLSEAYQVFPRIGPGTITAVLNDNLNLVSVDWDSGSTGVQYSVGFQGEFMLALQEDRSVQVQILHNSAGSATLSLSAHSSDVNYNGATYNGIVTVSSEPSFTFTPAGLVIQYQSSAGSIIAPKTALSSDIVVSLSVRVDQSVSSPMSGIASVTPSSVEMYRVDGVSEANFRSISITCTSAGTAFVRIAGIGGNYADVNHTALPITCLPGLVVEPTMVTTLASPSGAASVVIRPNVVPTERVTVAITASDSTLIRHTLRVFFEAFAEEQSQTIMVEHAGGFRAGTSMLSFAAHGGNYDEVVLMNAVSVPVANPSLVVAVSTLSVQPNSFALFHVYLDTPPSEITTVVATSSDPSVATVNGPLTTTDTSLIAFTVTHVTEGTAEVSLSVTAVAGSTYGNITLPPSKSVQVQAIGPGFFTSGSQLQVSQGGSTTFSVGPDTTPNSRTELIIEASVSGIVTINPASIFFEQGIAGQSSSVTLAWVSAGATNLTFRSKGGIYQNIERVAQVQVTALPAVPSAPTAVNATALPDRVIQVDFGLPDSGTELLTGFEAELSTSATFNPVAVSMSLGSDARQAVFTNLVRSTCYYYRVRARNAAGIGAAGQGGPCVRAVDAPSKVVDVQVDTISEELVVLRWEPPVDSGDGTPDGIAIVQYLVEAIPTSGGASLATIVQAANRVVTFTIVPGTAYTMQIRSITVNSPEPQPSPASFFFKYEGSPLNYFVPLAFSISATSISGVVGATSSFQISPAASPSVDAVVHISSSHPEAATATSKVIFKAGFTTAQTVIVAHHQVGESQLAFNAEGGNYAGLSGTLLLAETLPNEL